MCFAITNSFWWGAWPTVWSFTLLQISTVNCVHDMHIIFVLQQLHWWKVCQQFICKKVKNSTHHPLFTVSLFSAHLDVSNQFQTRLETCCCNRSCWIVNCCRTGYICMLFHIWMLSTFYYIHWVDLWTFYCNISIPLLLQEYEGCPDTRQHLIIDPHHEDEDDIYRYKYIYRYSWGRNPKQLDFFALLQTCFMHFCNLQMLTKEWPSKANNQTHQKSSTGPKRKSESES